MASVWGELKRRNVVKVAVAYAIVGWLLAQLAGFATDTFGAPDWVLQIFVVFLILGLPVALILAWAYELTPGGIKPASAVQPSEVVSPARKLDFVIIGLLVVALGFVAVDQYVLEETTESEPVATLQTSPPAVVEEQQEVLPNSVAVLPFENLSPDPENAYFAAGIHEEILNQLVKLSDLSVISRTSVVRYADSDLSIPEIASELNVGTVMEGSVRYAGDRVRITAQLIDAETDEHLWSEVYERDFADVFGIQADIATSIANALQAEFSLAEQQSIERLPTSSTAAYALYLRTLAAGGGVGDFSADLDRAIELDPDFGLAYAARAWEYSVALNYSAEVADPAEVARIGRESAERALELDPTLGLAHTALAGIAEANWQWAEAREHAERAYELAPNDGTVVVQLGRILRNSGETARSIQVLERGPALDPNNAFPYQQLALTHRVAGNYDEAVALLQSAIEQSPAGAGNRVNLAMAEVYRGNADEAVRLLRIAEQLFGGRPGQIFRYGQMGIAYAKAGQREDVERLFAAFEERAEETDVGDANWAYIHLALGEYDQALERLEAAMAAPAAINYTPLIAIKLNDWSDPVLEEPRFREVLAGLWSE